MKVSWIYLKGHVTIVPDLRKVIAPLSAPLWGYCLYFYLYPLPILENWLQCWKGGYFWFLGTGCRKIFQHL